MRAKPSGWSWTGVCILLAARVCLADTEWRITANTTVPPDVPTYPATDLVVDGCIVTMNGHYEFRTVSVINGGMITHPATASGTVNRVSLKANRIEVDGTSKMDVTDKGWPHLYGNLMVGASHGGRGGMIAPRDSLPAYGSLYEPDLPGYRAYNTSGAGGGVIYLETDELVLDGQLLANGNSGLTGSSGGSIWLNVGVITGTGSLSASATGATWVYGTSAGGRIAVYYEDAVGFNLNQIQARGRPHNNSTTGNGAAGTIYLRDKQAAQGLIRVDNTGAFPFGTAATEIHLPVTDSIEIIHARVEFFGDGELPELTVRGTNSMVIQHGDVTVSTVTLEGGQYLQQGALTVHTLNLSGGGWQQNAPVDITGNLWVGGGSWYSGADVSIPGGKHLVVDGVTLFASGAQVWDTIVVTNGGSIRAELAPDVSVTNRLHLEAQSIYVSADSSLDVSGTSRRVNHAGPHVNMAGGSHGGRGGRGSNTNELSAPTYGDLMEPVDAGMRGNTDRFGGGVLYVQAGEMVLEGTLRADGLGGSGGGGAGGSIWLDVGELRGEGQITAHGGIGGTGFASTPFGGGGGGRIAIHYTSMGGFDETRITAFGGGQRRGAAGTVFLHNKATAEARVRVDNTPHAPHHEVGTEIAVPAHVQLTAVNAIVVLLGDHVFTQPVVLEESLLSHTGSVSATSLQMTGGEWFQDGPAVMEHLTLTNVVWRQNALIEVTGSVERSGTWYSSAGVSFPGGNHLVVDGFTYFASGTQVWDTIVVTNGGSIRAELAPSAAVTNRVHLEAQSIYISADSSLDVSGTSRRTNTASGTGGSHGGRGGDSQHNVSGPVFGDYMEPVEAGSMGGSTTFGGGVIYVRAGELVLEGAIRANGTSSASGGAGGSIWLDVDVLRGGGLIAANGGNHTGSGTSGGAGGRIAIYYEDASGYDESRVQAYGGTGVAWAAFPRGGAGTIYWMNKGESVGRLVVDNTPQGGAGAATELTFLPGSDSMTVQARQARVVQINAAHLAELTLDGALWQQAAPLVTDELRGQGRARWEQWAPATVAAVWVPGDMAWVQQAPVQLPSGSNLVVSGWTWMPMYGQEWDQVTVGAAGMVTHPPTPIGVTNRVAIMARRLEVQASGGIDVSTNGWPGIQVGNNSSTGTGGSHGGAGGGAGGLQAIPVYGHELEPATPGTGGGSMFTNMTSGGGVVYIEVDELRLDGVIRADGRSVANQGAGAGGSIWIQTGILSGLGSISANGGNASSSAGGGGGRIAIYYTDAAQFNLNAVTVNGGTHGGTGTQPGQPGSLVLEHRLAQPEVTQVQPSGAINYLPDYVEVRFNVSMEASSFSPADATLWGPGGQWAFASMEAISPIQFRLHPAAPLTQAGVYVLEVGPNITATNGQAMAVAHAASFEVDLTPPAPPTAGNLLPFPATNFVRATTFTIMGTREANTEVWVNGVRRVALGSSAWSNTVSGLAQGANTIELRARDAAGNDSVVTPHLLFVDTVAPVVLTVDPPNQAYVNESPATVRMEYRETGSGLDGAQSTRTVTRLGAAVPGTWSSTTNVLLFTPSGTLSDGAYAVSARLVDQIGNTGALFTATFTVDTVAPMPPIVNPVTTPTTISQQTLTGWREAGTAIWLGDAQAVAVGTNVTWSLSVPLEPGHNEFALRARDRAGNMSAATNVVILFDDMPPGPVAITAAVAGVGTQITLGWSHYDELANGGDIDFYTVYQASSPFTHIAQATAIGTRPAGQKSFVVSNLVRNVTRYYAVVATDITGLSVSAVESLAAAPMDTVAPPNPPNLRFECGRSNLVVCWDEPADPHADLAGYRLYFGGGEGVALGRGVHHAERAGLLPATAYAVRVTSLDETGNESAGSTGTGITLLENPTNVAVETFSGTADLSWSASMPTNYVLHYRVYAATQAFTSVAGMIPRATATTRVATVTGLANDIEHHFAVVAVNLSGGVDSNVVTVAATPRPDTEGPVIGTLRYGSAALSNGFVAVRPDTIHLSASDRSGVSGAQVSVNEGAFHPMSQIGPTNFNWFWNVTAVSDGPHDIVFRVSDTLGNVTERSHAIMVQLAAPSAKPVIVSPAQNALFNSTQVTVAGTAPAFTWVKARVDGVDVPEPSVAVGANGAYSLPLTLGEGSSILTVVATNRGGVGPSSDPRTVMVDASIPRGPTGMRAKALPEGAISISWTKPDATQILGYNLYRAPGMFELPSQAIKVNTNLIAGLSYTDMPPQDRYYYYRATMVNMAGTEGFLSETGAGAVADRMPPRVLSVTYEPQGEYDPVTERLGPGEVVAQLQISEPLQAMPFFSITPQGGNPLAVSLRQTGETTYRGTFTITSNTPSGVAHAVFSGRDLAGNRGSVVHAGATLLMDTAGPTALSCAVQPASPIFNPANDPAVVEVIVQLDDAAAQAPSLEWRLSSGGAWQLIASPAPLAGHAWAGSLTLPSSAGAEPEYLQIRVTAQDDLNNQKTTLFSQAAQIYQGALPALEAPFGLTAESGPGGGMALRWEAVEEAADYQVYRQSPGEGDLAPFLRTGGATLFEETGTIEGTYRYAVASVRQAGGLESVSGPSAAVTATCDFTPPGAPVNLQLEVVGNGIRISWMPPPYTEPITYRLYRAGGTEITSVEGLTPLAAKLGQTMVVDPRPSPSAHVYTVTAVDAVGNESSPAVSAYLNVQLYPVTDLSVDLLDGAFPQLTWGHPQPHAMSGYHVYAGPQGGQYRLTGVELTQSAYTDFSWRSGERLYGVSALDAYGQESLRREVRLPAILTTVPDPTIKRGEFNRLRVLVSNMTPETVEFLQVKLETAGVTSQSETFHLDGHGAREVDVIVGTTTPSNSVGLMSTVEYRPAAGTLASLRRQHTLGVGQGGLGLDLVAGSFTRGGEGRLQWILRNTGAAELEIVTAAGNQPSPHVRIRLHDVDGNLLATAPFHQPTGDGIVSLFNGEQVARIAVGGEFRSAMAVIHVPANAPDIVIASVEIDRVYHRRQHAEETWLAGPKGSQRIQMVDTFYYAVITNVAPATSLGRTEIIMTGEARLRSNEELLPDVPVQITTEARGFERTETVMTGTNGLFRYAYRPMPGEHGDYAAAARHPDMYRVLEQAAFRIDGVTAQPRWVKLRNPVGYNQRLDVRVTARPGTTLSQVRWRYLAEDQPSGQLPAGITVETDEPVATLSSGQLHLLPVFVRGLQTGVGEIRLRLVCDDYPDEALEELRVEYDIREAQPFLTAQPGFIRAGIGRETHVTHETVIANVGMANLHGVTVELTAVNGEALPGWIQLITPEFLGTVGVGDMETIGLAMDPDETVPVGEHEFRIVVSSDEIAPFTIPVFVAVQESGIGSLLIKVTDIFTGTLNAEGQVIQGVAGARVMLSHEEIAEDVHVIIADEYGEALFEDLPAGRYNLRVTGHNHRNYNRRVWIHPGITETREVVLEYDLISVTWSVVPITVEDRYEIVMTANYATDVPAAVVTIEPGVVNLPSMAVGEVFHGELRFTNHGLIRADNVRFELPASNEYFRFEYLQEVPELLEPKQQFILPYRVTCMKRLDGE